MLQLYGLKAVNFLASDPFIGAKNLVNKYGEHASNFAFVAAVLALALVGIGFMFGSARLRQQLKSHLVWIIVGIAIVAAASYIISWSQSDAETFNAIAPILENGKLSLMSIL